MRASRIRVCVKAQTISDEKKENNTSRSVSPPVGRTVAPEKAAARAAHLRYVHDDMPGITRTGAPPDFRYRGPDGKLIQDRGTLERIRALDIPPAYQDVWICPLENGHLQATGKDARGRKQYRYHAAWRAVRDAAKYDRMLAFGEALPTIRARVDADLARRGLPREKVLATLVYLLEKTCIRVGNDEYAHSNESYGLTTMLNRHVDIAGSKLRFAFKGKSGKFHDIALSNPRVSRIVRACQELPGQALFQYLDEEGNTHQVHSGDVNAYLQEATGQEFTAKDFRTWAGTLACALCLAEGEAAAGPTQGKRIVAAAIKKVAQHLGNTPAICRKCYVHPAVIEAFHAGTVVRAEVSSEAAASATDLSPEEKAVLTFLKAQANSGGSQRLKHCSPVLP
jgi:DNA topoisomerase-1